MTPAFARHARPLLPLLALGALAALAGCGGTPLYATDGAARVQVQQLELRDPTDRRVPIRVAFPDRGTGLPIVLFSHGAYAATDDYAAILDAWAAHGYVVVAPTHPDSTAMGMARGDPAGARTQPARLVDMKLVIDQWPEIERRVPALAGRADRRRIAVAGHSFGGWIAQTLAGATTADAVTGATVTTGRDPRVSVAIVFSGPGALPPMLRPEDWRTLTVPTLVTVGGADLAQGTAGDGYAFRRQPYDLAPAGDKYLLVLADADHYLGGMVGRRDVPRSANGPAYVDAFVATSLAFLDAYLKGSDEARDFLREDEVGEFGRLERK
jgi:dienelactone hydrolase